MVVVHDDTLARTSDVVDRPEFASRAPFRVCDFTLAELRTLDAAARARFAGLPVPTLEEALRLTRDKG